MVLTGWRKKEEEDRQTDRERVRKRVERRQQTERWEWNKWENRTSLIFLSLGFLRLFFCSSFVAFFLLHSLSPSFLLSLSFPFYSFPLPLDLHLKLSSSGRKETKIYSAKRNDVSGDKLTRFSCHDTFRGFVFNCLLFFFLSVFFSLSFFPLFFVKSNHEQVCVSLTYLNLSYKFHAFLTLWLGLSLSSNFSLFLVLVCRLHPFFLFFIRTFFRIFFPLIRTFSRIFVQLVRIFSNLRFFDCDFFSSFFSQNLMDK